MPNKMRSVVCLEGEVIKQEQQNVSSDKIIKMFYFKLFNKYSYTKEFPWPQPQGSNWEDNSAAAFLRITVREPEYKARGAGGGHCVFLWS